MNFTTSRISVCHFAPVTRFYMSFFVHPTIVDIISMYVFNYQGKYRAHPLTLLRRLLLCVTNPKKAITKTHLCYLQICVKYHCVDRAWDFIQQPVFGILTPKVELQTIQKYFDVALDLSISLHKYEYALKLAKLVCYFYNLPYIFEFSPADPPPPPTTSFVLHPHSQALSIPNKKINKLYEQYSLLHIICHPRVF